MTGPGRSSAGPEATTGAAYQIGMRAVDHQLRLVSAEHAKLEGLIRLGVAIVAGKLVIAGLVLNSPVEMNSVTWTWVAMGVVLDLVGIFGLFWATVFGARETRAVVGMDVPDLRDQIAVAKHDVLALSVSALEAFAAAHEENDRLLRVITKARAMAGVWIGGGVVAHLISLTYIVRGAIGA